MWCALNLTTITLHGYSVTCQFYESASSPAATNSNVNDKANILTKTHTHTQLNSWAVIHKHHFPIASSSRSPVVSANLWYTKCISARLFSLQMKAHSISSCWRGLGFAEKSMAENSSCVPIRKIWLSVLSCKLTQSSDSGWGGSWDWEPKYLLIFTKQGETSNPTCLHDPTDAMWETSTCHE